MRDHRGAGASCPGRRRFVSVVVGLALACVPACNTAPANTVSDSRLTTPLEPLAPSGDVHGPVTFSWRGTSGNPVVRIYIVDAAERAVTDFEARGEAVAAPQVVQDALIPDKVLGWRVAVIDDNGEPTRTSALTRFTWRRH